MNAHADSSEQFEHEQSKALKRFVIASIVVHLLLFVAHYFEWISPPAPMMEEWAIETDLVSDINPGAVTKTVIDGAKVAEEVTVPKNQLPQLPKQITTTEPAKEDPGLADGEIEEPEEIKPKKEENKKESPVEMPSDPKVANKVDPNDLLKRQALEKLKALKTKEDKELKADASGKTPSIKEDNSEGSPLPSENASAFSRPASLRYQGYLSKTIKRNYKLPETYKFKKGSKDVLLAIRINSQGRILEATIEESSGDEVLDAYCLEAVKRSAPFEPPPNFLAGETIRLNFSP